VEKKPMADKMPQNVPGRFYVDGNCINCSLCVEIAGQLFETNQDEGYEYIKRQPRDAAERELVEEVIQLCPADAVQDNG
jgi:ferredoxin